MTMDTMRDRFVATTTALLDTHKRLGLVLADIGVGRFADVGATTRYPGRVVNVGIREQAMLGVAAGLALAGIRPIVHTYAPFLVERTFEQLKLDLSHQDLGAVLMSVGASYDASASGRTHHAPADVAAVATLPGWNIHVPGHPDELEAVLRRSAADEGRNYIRMSEEANAESRHSATTGAIDVVRSGSRGAPTVLAVGPTLDPTLAAAEGRDVTVAYTITPHPLDAVTLRDAVTGPDVVVVEPYLAGTSAHAVTEALRDRPVRLTSLGVANAELRSYGTPEEHRTAHGLDASGIGRALDQAGAVVSTGFHECSARYRWTN